MFFVLFDIYCATIRRLKNIIKNGIILNIAGSSNGRTLPFEGKYLGSNPSPAALLKNKDKFGGVK